MKRLLGILLTAFAFTNLAREIRAQCENKSSASFILGTNVYVSAQPYKTVAVSSLEGCAEACKSQQYCKSALFKQNETTMHCFLYNANIRTSKLNREAVTESELGSYYLEKICLKSTCQRLFTFEMVVGGELGNYQERVLHNVTMTDCLQECVSENTFRSAQYDQITSTCKINIYDRYSRSNRFQYTNKTSLYFDSNCALQPAFEGTTAEVILLGNAQHPYIISEHKDKTVGECGQLCLHSIKFPCRSFLYGQKNGSSYCALSHQNRIGLLKKSNSFKPTELLNYYEIARNLDACDASDIHFELMGGVYLHDTPFKTVKGASQSDCLNWCRNSTKCHAVNVDFVKDTCAFFEIKVRSTLSDRLRNNDMVNYFEKICLTTGEACPSQWAFERVRGRRLVSTNLKVAVAAFSKEECLAACIEHPTFDCQSAEYDYRLSECHLNVYSRFHASDKTMKMQSTRSDVDYFENNCYKEPRGFCNIKTHKRIRFGNPDEVLPTGKFQECKSACLANRGFNCHSYSFNEDEKKCFLNHHSTSTIPYNAVSTEKNWDTYELTTCYEVSVSCDPHLMKVNVRTSSIFDGKIYVKNKPDTCFADVTRTTNFNFSIMLTGPDCATEEEGEGKFSNVIVIQNNDLVLTSSDKAVGVHCTYELGNRTEFAILTIKNLSSSETSKGRASPPQLTMRILDLKGNDKTTVKLGEPLRVQVSVPDESAYGIFVRNMVASDASGTSNLTLIDNKGCPAEAKMIREMRRIDGQSRALESLMEAFTFTGSNVLRIETDVETCLESCRPVVCHVPSGRSDDQLLTVESLGRRRRDTDDEDNQVFKLTKTVSIHSDTFEIGMPPKRSLKSLQQSGPIFSESDEYQYEQEVETKTNGDICMDSMLLTIGGCAFLFAQIILLSVCVATKYYRKHSKLSSLGQLYQQRPQRQPAEQSLPQMSQFQESSLDSYHSESYDIVYQASNNQRIDYPSVITSVRH